jgi:cyclophilin family peptidyl-prolyl cis-trans isomerase
MTDNRRAEVDQATENIDFDSTSYQIEFQTSLGRITLDLWPELAPGHCRNIIGLARIGYYDGIIFHRVIAGFMAQVGCPLGTGTGGPGYTIDAEFNDQLHEAGVLSMARTSDPNSAGSQLFLCLDRAPHLDRQYTAFGKTADDSSLETLLTIGRLATDGQDRPTDEVRIETGQVIELSR